MLKIDGSLPRNIDFEVANLKARAKTRGKILKLQSVKIGGSLARKARFDAPTSLVSSLWFSCGVAVSMGEAAKSLLFEGFQAGCHVVLRGRGGTLHSTLRTLHSTLHTLHSTTLYTLHTPHSTLYTLHATLHTRHFPLHTLHSTLYTPLLTPQFTLYTPHSTLYTLHFALSTPPSHSTLYILHSTIYTLDATL